MNDTELLSLESDIEAEVAKKVPELVGVIRAMLEENPNTTVSELATGFLFLPSSHLAWYTAFLFMERAKNA